MMKEHELLAGGHRLAATTWGDVGNGRPTIVMMHGGLDCISTWKDLPQVVAEASGWPVLAYDRHGYGRSERLAGGREPSYRREEAGPVLGEVLRHFHIDQTLMFGHSDGGAMSVLAAAAHPERVCGVLACSPARPPWPLINSWWMPWPVRGARLNTRACAKNSSATTVREPTPCSGAGTSSGPARRRWSGT
ncbi:alpha/beta hydrolase [Rhodoferax sp.]|uniref:alpha/beta hydrolase n=1 Tax=Rhodoferax sp. TaxID=50421 RepID=UPI003BB5F72F